MVIDYKSSYNLMLKVFQNAYDYCMLGRLTRKIFTRSMSHETANKATAATVFVQLTTYL